MTGIHWQREFIRYKRGAASIMVGRPRKIGKREANGRISRIKDDPDAMTRDLDRFMDDPTAIYVTEAGAMCKIGITKNPTQRSRALQTSNGNAVRMVWYRWMDGPAAKKLEKAIHKQHQGSRWHAHGEWYYLDKETAIGIIAKKTADMGLFAINEKWNAFAERHWDDPTRDNLPNPFRAEAV